MVPDADARAFAMRAILPLVRWIGVFGDGGGPPLRFRLLGPAHRDARGLPMRLRSLPGLEGSALPRGLRCPPPGPRELRRHAPRHPRGAPERRPRRAARA